MRRKDQKLTVTRHFTIDGKSYLESEISEKRSREIYVELERRAMEAVGFRAVKKEGTAEK